MLWPFWFISKLMSRLGLIVAAGAAGFAAGLLLQAKAEHRSWAVVPADQQRELPGDELERLIHTLEEEMAEASQELRFEYAARLEGGPLPEDLSPPETLAFLRGFALRGEGLDPWAATGIVLIIGSGVTIALRGR